MNKYDNLLIKSKIMYEESMACGGYLSKKKE